MCSFRRASDCAAWYGERWRRPISAICTKGARAGVPFDVEQLSGSKGREMLPEAGMYFL